MATWFEQQRKARQQTRRLKASGYKIPAEEPLLFSSGRGRRFGG
jgi:hypothetical protein